MSRQSPAAQSPTQLSSALSSGRLGGALVLLLAVYVLNFLDRQIVNILAEPMSRELGLVDWQLGLMSGTAFALFYALAGIPIARQAERRDRPAIIAIALACWSLFTILCGLASTFWQMLLFRFGVGIGEAGGVPPAHSLISDYAPREKRAGALAFFHMGLPIGTLFGLALGGIVADAYGWRVAFIAAGAPGLVLAVAIMFFLPEPRRNNIVAKSNAALGSGFSETLRHLWGKPTFRSTLFAAALISFVSYAHQAFLAPFFFRFHGNELAALAERTGLGPIAFLGISLGLIFGLFGTVGLWLGGRLADRGMLLRGPSGYGRVAAASLLVFTPVQIVALLIPDIFWALLCFAPAMLLVGMWIGPAQATIQSVAPAHMRATASAILLLGINLIGLGLGPLLLGIASDTLAAVGDLGPTQGLRWALVIFTLPALAAAALFSAASSSAHADIAG